MPFQHNTTREGTPMHTAPVSSMLTAGPAGRSVIQFRSFVRRANKTIHASKDRRSVAVVDRSIRAVRANLTLHPSAICMSFNHKWL